MAFFRRAASIEKKERIDTKWVDMENRNESSLPCMLEKNGFLKFSVIVAYNQIINQTKCIATVPCSSFTIPSQFLAVAEYFLLIFQKWLVMNAVNESNIIHLSIVYIQIKNTFIEVLHSLLLCAYRRGVGINKGLEISELSNMCGAGVEFL